MREHAGPLRGGLVVGLAGLVASLAVAWCAPAVAHVALANRSLHLLVAEADRIVHARILETDLLIELPGGAGQRPAVSARVLDVLKGAKLESEIRFVQHGHGVATFAKGEEVLLFLRHTARTRELEALAGVVDWVSLQEHDAKYAIEPATREVLFGAVRGYVAAEALAAPTARVDAIRRATVDLLTSGDPRLASAALADLAMAPKLPLIVAADLPRLEPVLNDPGTSMGVRVGLLSELERRRLVAGPPRWVALLDGAQGGDLRTAIRAAGAHPSDPVRERLAALLAGWDTDAAVSAEAAVALGATRDVEAVAPLTGALDAGDAGVRSAAIRGLGRIPGPEALAALEAAAVTHPDPSTRRRAEAEVRKRGGSGS